MVTGSEPPLVLRRSVISFAQVLKKFGAVNLPVWYEAGKYAQESSPIPFSECPAPPSLGQSSRAG